MSQMNQKEKEDAVKELYINNPFPPEKVSLESLESHAWVLKSIPKSYKFEKNIDIADIGCGTGGISCFLSRLGKVDGYDFSKPSIEIARALAKELKIDINFIEEDITETKQRKKYDIIFSIGVLHHIPQHWQAIENIKRMMKPTSIFIVGVYNKWANINGLWKSSVKEERYLDAFNHPYEIFYSKHEYKKILENHNLKVIGIYNNAPDFLRLLTGRGRIVSYCCQLNQPTN